RGAARGTKNLPPDGDQAAAIHGNRSQNARQAALKACSSGRARMLVATDIAARGIDVPNISHVINYELPDDPETYVHRIGRTGRNGATGTAITLVGGDERAKLREIERLIRRTLPLENAPKAGEAEASEGPARSTHRKGPSRPAGDRRNPSARHKPNDPRNGDAAKKDRPLQARKPGG